MSNFTTYQKYMYKIIQCIDNAYKNFNFKKVKDNKILYDIFSDYKILISKHKLNNGYSLNINIYFHKYCVHHIYLNSSNFGYTIATKFWDDNTPFLYQNVLDIALTKNYSSSRSCKNIGNLKDTKEFIKHLFEYIDFINRDILHIKYSIVDNL